MDLATQLRLFFSYPGRAGLENLLAASMANDTGTITAYVMMQPNGRIMFYVSVQISIGLNIIC